MEMSVEQLANGVVKLEWWPPADARKVPGLIQQYRVEWRRDGETGSVEMPHIVNEYQLNDLQPNSSYQLRVLASTRAGFPPPSMLADQSNYPWTDYETPAFQVDPMAVMRSPRLETVVVNDSTVRVSWSFDGPIDNATEMRVLYGPVAESDVRMVSVEANESAVLLSSLRPASLYRVTVHAVSANGQAGLESSKIFETEPVAVTEPQSVFKQILEPPFDIQCSTGVDDTAQIRWTMPPSIFTIVKFNIRLTPVAHNSNINASRVKHYFVDRM